MLEKYYMYKPKYKEYILMIKSGNFYEIIGKDALIMNDIFGYKISKISNTLKCGFPINSLDKVEKTLENHHINFVVIENTNHQTCFKNNNYKKYGFEVDDVMYNFLRIDKITKYLNENVLNKNVGKILDEMEKLI